MRFFVRITRLSISGNLKKLNIRKLPEEDRREVRSTITNRLAAGELDLGSAVRLMRLAAGMSQVKYAKMTGVDLRVLAKIENGEGNPRLETLEKLGKPFGLIVSFIKPSKESLQDTIKTTKTS
jgi:DNA-binding XRE family transcriptional regulator